MKTIKTLIKITLISTLLAACATPTECYGQTLTIYSVCPDTHINNQISIAEANIKKGQDITYMGFGFMAITHLTTMMIPANIDNGLFVPVDRIRMTSVITGGIVSLVGQRIVYKNKKKKKRFARLK